MSLADDMEPEDCIEMCYETIEKNLLVVAANMPGPNDGPEELARKYTILGSRMRAIKEYLKEAQKAVVIGSDSVAFLLLEKSKHRPLEDFATAKEMVRDLKADLKKSGAIMEMKIE